MPEERPWSDADRELVVRAWYDDPTAKPWRWEPASADRVLDALTAAGWRPPPPEPDGVHWRTGGSVGRTIYNPYGDLAGLMHTTEQACAVVAALNAAAKGGTDADT